MHSFLCRFTPNPVDQLPKKSLMDMVGKSWNYNGSIHQNLQYSFLRKQVEDILENSYLRK